MLDGVLVEIDIEIAPMFADQFFAAVAETVAGLAVYVENGGIVFNHEERVGRVIDEGTEARLARAQLLFCPLPLGDVAREAQEPVVVLHEMALADLDRERAPVLAPVAGLESDGFPGKDALPYARDGHRVDADIKVASIPADQFFPRVAQTFAGLAVDV